MGYRIRKLFIACVVLCIGLPVVWIVTYHEPELVHVANVKWTGATIGAKQQGLFPEVKSSNGSTVELTKRTHLLGNARRMKSLEAKILIVSRVKTSKLSRQVQYILDAQRITYDVFPTTSYVVPDLVDTRDSAGLVGRYSLIIMVDIISTLVVGDVAVYDILSEYCTIFGAAMIFITAPLQKSTPLVKYAVKNNGEVVIGGRMKLVAIPLSKKSPSLSVNEKPYFRYLRDGGEYEWNSYQSELVAFDPLQLYLSGQRIPDTISKDKSTNTIETLVSIRTVLQSTNHDQSLPVALIEWADGSMGGFVKGFSGLPLTSSFGKLVLIEMLNLIPEQQGKPVLRFHNKRYVQVDIDDVFFAPSGFNPTSEDIKELINVQKLIQDEYVPGFKFNMGFCGARFKHGSPSEMKGKEELVKNSRVFNWFDHTYSHIQPHKLTYSKLMEEMVKNKQFAKEYNIPLTSSQYSVSPHHSGVYPVYGELYRTWKEVWNITVTSTEEYPHFKPASMRRGFIHDGIQVLPRQTCGIYTHISKYGDLKGGEHGLDSIAVEGEVFVGILHNPVSIFMTHYNNYGSDRLALKLFTAAFSFLKQWTKLELVHDNPTRLGGHYFEIFPEDKTPLWSSPCNDQRHLDISPFKNCSQSPSLVIVGPQKTGSTALHFFLKAHPHLVTNPPTKHAFEEIQFFSSDHYYSKGVEWYLSLFPSINASSSMLFEKSATYFTHSLAPQRISSFNPKMKIIVILADPIKRAYSWYQHMRSHKDHVALQYNFTQVITAHRDDPRAPPTLINLRNRCLVPGLYYQHILKWLEYFQPEQLYFVDGEELVEDPVNVLIQITRFLDLPVFNYRRILRFSPRKGFYCLTNKQGKEMCLGVSKGRRYPNMSPSTVKYLSRYYSHPNRMLYKLLLKYSINPPSWLNRGFSVR